MDESIRKRATMEDVASHAGVSVMTVSRVLKNYPRVSEQTRNRVLKAAEELSYRPNPLVSALMGQIRHSRGSGDCPVIALLTAHPDTVYEQANTYNGQILCGAASRAHELGYKLEKFSLTEPRMSAQRLRQILISRGIYGVIQAPLPDPIPVLDFDWSGFACASIGYSYKRHRLNRAANDQFNSIREAVKVLRTRGFRRIGLAIRYEDDQRVDSKWVGGFLSFHPYFSRTHCIPPFLWHYQSAQGNCPPSPRPHWKSWDGSAEIPTGFGAWVARYKPEVIISLQPLMIKEWLRMVDDRAVEKIQIVNLNIQPRDNHFSGIDQNNHLLGAAAVELVIEQVHRNEYGLPAYPKTVEIIGSWVDQGQQLEVRPDVS